MVRRLTLAAALLLALPTAAHAQQGLLLVAHGAGHEWNARVRETLAQVNWAQGPAGVAFLMGEEADSAGWGAAVARLVRDGAREIVVVPLMVSSHGSHYRQIRYYAGELDSLPPELAAHDHHSAHAAPGVPMRVTPALDAAPRWRRRTLRCNGYRVRDVHTRSTGRRHAQHVNVEMEGGPSWERWGCST